jgi:hypothetical protein
MADGFDRGLNTVYIISIMSLSKTPKKSKLKCRLNTLIAILTTLTRRQRAVGSRATNVALAFSGPRLP